MIGLLVSVAITANGLTIDCSQWTKNSATSWAINDGYVHRADGSGANHVTFSNVMLGLWREGGQDVFSIVNGNCQ